MATNPTSKNASFAALQVHHNLVAVNDRYARLQIACGTTTPPTYINEPVATAPPSLSTTGAIFHPRNTALDVAYHLSTSNNNAGISTAQRNLGIGFFLFRDNQDGGGLGTSRVKFYNFDAVSEPLTTYNATVNFGNIAAGVGPKQGSIQILAADLAQPGTYKLVPVMWRLTDGTALEDDTNPPTTARVTNGTEECYADADSNAAAASNVGDDPIFNVFDFGRVAWIRVAADAQSVAAANPATSQRYGNTPDITYDLTAGTLNNPKQIRVGPIPPASAVTVAQTKVITQTPVAAGTRPATVTYNVDSLFPAASTAHTHRLYVGPRGGQSSTPAGEKPDLLASGTVVVPDVNDQTWVVFGSAGMGAGLTLKDAYTIERTATFNVGSGIFPKKDAGAVTAGVGVYKTSGYATTQDIFKRRGPTVTTDAQPFLETYIFDAFGAVIPSTAFGETVRRQTDDGAIDTQAVATDANGRIRWNYIIVATAAAFSRYVKAGFARQTGSHVATGPDDPLSPPATFTLGNSNHPADYPGPYPGYPRRVRITGNAYSGVNEPTSTLDNVFGINSEVEFEDIWKGTTSGATLDGNGVPTGAGQRLQNLGAGSLRAKFTTLIDEGSVRVITLGEHGPKDIAGRNLVVTTDNLFLRRAAFNDTLDTVIDAGTSLNDAQTALNNSIGYRSANNSLDTIAPTADPASVLYYLACADTSAQRGTFALTLSGTDPVVGFDGDVGNFSSRTQPVSFIAIDPAVNMLLSAETAQSDPTLVRRFTVFVARVTTDNLLIGLAPDAAPFYFVLAQGAPGTPMVVVSSGTATIIGSAPSSDWEFYVTMPSGVRAVKVVAFCKVAGALVIGGDKVGLQIGYEFDAVGTFVGFQFR